MADSSMRAQAGQLNKISTGKEGLAVAAASEEMWRGKKERISMKVVRDTVLAREACTIVTHSAPRHQTYQSPMLCSSSYWGSCCCGGFRECRDEELFIHGAARGGGDGRRWLWVGASDEQGRVKRQSLPLWVVETRSRTRSRNHAFNERVVGNRGQCRGGREHSGAAGVVVEVVAEDARDNDEGMRCWHTSLK